MRVELMDGLKCERDISIKPVFSDGKSMFRSIPTLTLFRPGLFEPCGNKCYACDTWIDAYTRK